MKLSKLSMKLCRFYHQNRCLLIMMMPSWIFSTLFVLIVAAYCLTPTIVGIDLTSFVLVILLGVVAIIASLCSIYAYFFMYDVYTENIERLQRIYLNGYPAWEYIDSRIFSRLRFYVGYDLCYEAAALEMMAWQGHRATHYVFANIRDRGKRCRYDHSWIEVKCYGIWWVIDPTQGDPVDIMPRWLYNLVHFTHYIRDFNSCGFWTSSLANKFYKRLNQSETSYLFGELGLFRRDPTSNKMYADSLCVNSLGSGRLRSIRKGYCFFEEQMPISQEILAQFLAKPERLIPTLDAQKHARAAISGMRIKIA